MRILTEQPPIIDRIRAVLPITGKEIFAWGDIIYNPGNIHVPPWLIAHEEVHQRQQAGDPEGWWERYLADPEWRMAQEAEASRTEYAAYCAAHRDRNARARYFTFLVGRLTSKIYGGVMAPHEAAAALHGRG